MKNSLLKPNVFLSELFLYGELVTDDETSLENQKYVIFLRVPLLLHVTNVDNKGALES